MQEAQPTPRNDDAALSILAKTDASVRWYERVGAIVGTTLFLVAGGGFAIAYLRHHRVGAWVPVAVAVALLVIVAIAFVVGRRTARAAVPIGPPTQADDALTRVVHLEGAVAGAEYEKRLLWDALESIQQALASEDDWELDQLVERGVLGPARGFLLRAPQEDVRIAVLFPRSEAPDKWWMRWAAGHRPESVKGYERDIDKTLAGISYRRGEFVEVADVRTDGRFEAHPKETRPFTSLVALPLRTGEEVVGSLSVVSTRPSAFSQSDVAFIKLMGAVIDVLLASEYDAARWERVIDKQRERAGGAERQRAEESPLGA
jgi:hypothetical protein